MKLNLYAVGAALLIWPGCALAGSDASSGPMAPTIAVAEPARAGSVNGTDANSDAFVWKLFTQITAPVSGASQSPVVFETWATDADIYTATPHWPAAGEPKKFHGSLLSARTHGGQLDVPCAAPANPAAGRFPTSGTPTPCVAEEVVRNRAEYDYIVNNGLNTKAGLTAAFARNFKVDMPRSSIAVKGDWVPVQTMIQWIPELRNATAVRQFYYTTVSDGVEYALVAMHVSSKQNPLWVWATFEHQFNPGRCDVIGCYDSFGATTPVVLPNRTVPNTQYGMCLKSPVLRGMMTSANLAPAWQNYCLKSSQVSFTGKDNVPTVLGNSVTERVVANVALTGSSCIGCHAYASYGANGATTPLALDMLAFNPSGLPLPGAFVGSKQYDFMWGVLLAP